MRRDAIVIGSGVGGMTAALLLALEGLRVALVERAPRVAPLIRRLERERLFCDIGFHYLGGLSEGGGFQSMLRLLGLLDRFETTPMSPDAVDILTTGDEPPVRMAQGPERVRQAFHERFPDDRAAIDAYLDRVLAIYAGTPFLNLDADMGAYRPSDETLADFLAAAGAGAAFSRAVAQRGYMLSGLTDEESSLRLHAFVVGSYIHASHALVDGGDALANAFETRLAEMDVEILSAHTALAIQTDDRRNVRGVELLRPGGERNSLECDVCVSTAHPRELLRMLAPGAIRRGRRRRLENMPETFAPFLLHLDVADIPKTLLRSNCYAFPDGTSDGLAGISRRNRALAVMAGDPASSSGRRALCVLRQVWENVPKRGRCAQSGSTICRKTAEENCGEFDENAYNRSKEKWTEETLENLFRLFPETRGKCRLVSATTPCALERLTGTSSIYGPKQIAGHQRVGHLGPARGLFLAGQSIGVPGVQGAVTSGFVAASGIAGWKTIREEIAPMPLNRVVVTGMGSVSPYGNGVATLWDNLEAGRSSVVGMREEWKAKIPELTCLAGAPLAEPLDAKAIPRKFRRTMGPVAQMAWLAAREAIDQAGVPKEIRESGRMGVIFASTTGSVSVMERSFSQYFAKNFKQGLSTGVFFQIMSHTCAANLAHAFGICGRTLSPDAACASGALAIGLAFEALQEGRQDIMLCGGADELAAMVTGCFDLVHASSHRYNDRPQETPRPFDRDRDGTVCGEGAGALTLETEKSALERGAPILAEIAGFATLADGSHLAQPHADSVARCLHNALDNARLLPDAIDYVNAHGTGTLMGDAAEARALAEVFASREPPVGSLKGHVGHTLGASGALELIAAIEMMRKGKVLPTLNLENVAEECQGADFLTAPREVEIRAFIKNSFAFGGVNSVLAVKGMNMLDEQNIDRVGKVLIEEFELEEDALKPAANLYEDLGLDSLDSVDLVVALEREFGFKIKREADEERIRAIRTLQDLYDFIELKRGELE